MSDPAGTHKPNDIVHITFPLNVNIVAGLGTGLASSMLFHPLDRALFLRARSPYAIRKTIFAEEYWAHPYSGFRSTFYQRLLSQGIYFAAQGEFNRWLLPFLREELEFSEFGSKFIIGSSIGVLTGAFSNASNAVKHYSYKNPNGTPLGTAIKMLNKGGVRPFFNGICPGIMRDITFGSLYESINVLSDQFVLRKLPEDNPSLHDAAYMGSRFFSAVLATVASSPFNHARAMQFATPMHKPKKSTTAILISCWLDSDRHLKSTAKDKKFFKRLRYLKGVFNVGLGSARSGLGMMTGQLLYNRMTAVLRKWDDNEEGERVVRRR